MVQADISHCLVWWLVDWFVSLFFLFLIIILIFQFSVISYIITVVAFLKEILRFVLSNICLSLKKKKKKSQHVFGCGNIDFKIKAPAFIFLFLNFPSKRQCQVFAVQDRSIGVVSLGRQSFHLPIEGWFLTICSVSQRTAMLKTWIFPSAGSFPVQLTYYRRKKGVTGKNCFTSGPS